MITERKSWGTSIFCDDIRAEIGGKTSLMGIYHTDMIFPVDFPLIIPKFVVFVKYFESISDSREDLILKVFLPGDDKDKPTFSHLFKRAELDTKPPSYSPIEEDVEYVFTINFPVVFSPFHIQKEGVVRVRMQRGNVTTKIGALMLRKAKPEDNI
jgi:hypothetical protein